MTTLTGTVLVVDDNELNRFLLTSRLQQDGHTVITAEHGRRALQLLYGQPCDVVLLDLMMPEMDGFQVLERIKSDPNLQHIPVIVISALDEMESVVRSIEMGAADHLPKPFDPVLLRARLNASLAAKRLHDRQAEYLRDVTYLTNAAASVEAGAFVPESVAVVAERDDALGRLARVFEQMARQVDARERHLKQQNQFKSALIGKITHELRSPFVAAGFSVQLLQRYAEHGMIDELREQIVQLDRQLAAGRRMIDGVISFASFVGKRSEMRREETGFGQMVRETVDPLTRVARTRRVSLSYDLVEHLPPVKIDREQMSEAIHHLVHNAIRFNREGGHVKVVCWRSDHQLVFWVEDTGSGVEADKLETIWEAFAQTGDDVQRGVEGLGLGLALVKYVVDAHQGEVVARSKPGEGSVFGFRIPLE